jgi:hypothetical protein
MAIDQYRYTDHERKEVIRTQWCKEHLKLLVNHFSKKLIYLGLPGIRALDILDWIDFLDKVIVFQCSDYKEDGDTSCNADFSELESLLESLEDGEKIKTYALFKGFIEDIVIGGFDEDGSIFNLSDFITVYNLDFCNGLTTPRTTRTLKGDVIQYLKIDVVEKLFEYQNTLSEKSSAKNFLFYLTVHSNFLESKMEEVKSREISNYRKKYSKIKKGKDAITIRDLKAYTFYKLSKIFKNLSFHFEFLPPIFYQGSSYPNREKGGKYEHHWMLTFTVLGSKVKEEEKVYEQDIKTFLENKFIFASNTNIRIFTDNHLPFRENDYDPNPVNLLKESYVYNNYWK